MIYFVQAGKDGPVKIGKSKNIAKRVRRLATAHYEQLSVLATIDAPDDYERSLHQMLAAHRISGEWFAWCDEVRSAVELAKSGKILPLHGRKRTAHVVVRLRPMDYADIAEAAKESGVSLASFVEKLIEEWFASERAA